MRFPAEIRQRMRKLLEEKAEYRRQRLVAARAWKKKLEDLEKLRKSRKAELRVSAGEVLRWLEEFLASEDTERLFMATDKTQLVVFCDSFWQGFPTDGVYCYATFEVSRRGAVFYGERYKGMQAKMVKLGKAPMKRSVLVKNLHPDYLKNLAGHFKSGKVWEYLLKTMPDKALF